MSPLKNAMHMREMPKLHCAVEKARGKATEAASSALGVSIQVHHRGLPLAILVAVVIPRLGARDRDGLDLVRVGDSEGRIRRRGVVRRHRGGPRATRS